MTKHEDLRQRLLAGEEAQILLTPRMRMNGFKVIASAELRLRTEGGRWPRKPDLLMVPCPENGPEDSASVLGDIAKWLAAGRDIETNETDPKD